MRKNFGAKPWTYPQPVFILGSYNEDGTPNAMNAAWGGISSDEEVCICVDSSHLTTKNILARKAFTVSIGTEATLVACDYVGIVSGKKEPKKVEKAGFHTVKSELVDAPIIEELPLTLECRLISYDPETCHMFGQILNVSADESILTDGKIDVTKLKPITFDSVGHGYYGLSARVGNAFKDGAKLK